MFEIKVGLHAPSDAPGNLSMYSPICILIFSMEEMGAHFSKTEKDVPDDENVHGVPLSFKHSLLNDIITNSLFENLL